MGRQRRWLTITVLVLGGPGCSDPGKPPEVVSADAKQPASADPEGSSQTIFRCGHCGQDHPGPLLSYGIPAPLHYDLIPEADRARRAALTDDQCLIDEKEHYLAGNLEIPIKGSAEHLTYTVWVSLSDKSFERVTLLWEKPGRESEPPYFGWLSNRVPGYPDTINLKTLVHTRPVGVRPSIELAPTDHPLAVAQREGITWDQVREITERAHHPEPDPEPKVEEEQDRSR